jgi:3-dehydrosphinganine reductase
MNRFLHQNILITGGSTGIGLAIAREFAQLGGRLFILARGQDQLNAAAASLRKEFPHVQVKTYAVDIADRQRVAEVIREIGDGHGGIHTVVNNAGISGQGRLEDQNLDKLHKVMEVNYFGALHVIKAAWPYLKQARAGHIGFVSSIAGYIGLIGFSTYAPTKFALSGLAECLRMEAKAEGIGVTIVYPPDTKTDLLERERKNALPETVALSKSASLLEPEEVAAAFVEGIRKNRFEVYCNRRSVWIRRFRILLPRVYFSVLDRIAKVG